MAIKANAARAEVVILGDAETRRKSFVGDGATQLRLNDLIRITTTNTVKQAVAGSNDNAGSPSTVGPVHGMCLKDYDAAVPATEYVPVLLFAVNTVIRLQVHHDTPASALPSNAADGKIYALVNHGTGIWGLDLEVVSTEGTNSHGVVRVDGNQPGVVKWFDPIHAASALNGFVYVRPVSQAFLDGKSA